MYNNLVLCEMSQEYVGKFSLSFFFLFFKESLIAIESLIDSLFTKI